MLKQTTGTTTDFISKVVGFAFDPQFFYIYSMMFFVGFCLISALVDVTVASGNLPMDTYANFMADSDLVVEGEVVGLYQMREKPKTNPPSRKKN